MEYRAGDSKVIVTYDFKCIYHLFRQKNIRRTHSKHSNLGPHMPVINQENTPQACPSPV